MKRKRGKKEEKRDLNGEVDEEKRDLNGEVDEEREKREEDNEFPSTETITPRSKVNSLSRSRFEKDLMTGVALGQRRKRTSDTAIDKCLELIQSSIASGTEMSNSGCSLKKSEPVSSLDPYSIDSIEAGVRVLNEMGNITAQEYIAAMRPFMQADWRTALILMPDEARRAWLAKEAQK